MNKGNEIEEQEMEFSVTGDISDKLANPEETSKAKKKRKAHEKLVILHNSGSKGLSINHFIIEFAGTAKFYLVLII